MHAPALQLRFAQGGNATQYLLAGWSHQEDAYIWSIGPEARLILPWPADLPALCLEIRVRPMMHDPGVLSQRMDMVVNGATIGTAVVTRSATLGFVVPPALRAAEMAITIRQPDATSPASVGVNQDKRALAFAVEEIALWPAPAAVPPVVRPPLPPPGISLEDAVRGVTGMPAAHMMSHFESIGWNCEFGIVQQAMGVERVSLLRFAGVGQTGLLSGLPDGFSQLCNPAQIQVDNYENTEKSEYFIRCGYYLAEFHTTMTKKDVTAERAGQLMLRRFGFLCRKLVETMQDAQTLFVWQSGQPISDAEALPVLNALRRHGNNALLYVTTGTDFPPGTVEQRLDGLYRGWRRGPVINTWDKAPELGLWLSLCANAYRLWRESGRGAAQE